MTAEEIREMWEESDTDDDGVMEELGMRMVVELAAQLAELNQTLREVAIAAGGITK